jgi:hypothetical protein
MAKLFGIVLLVLGLWAGLEIYTNGFDEAFGGLFAGFGGKPHADSSSGVSRAKALGTKVQTELDDATRRETGGEDAGN